MITYNGKSLRNGITSDISNKSVFYIDESFRSLHTNAKLVTHSCQYIPPTAFGVARNRAFGLQSNFSSRRGRSMSHCPVQIIGARMLGLAIRPSIGAEMKTRKENLL